MVSRSISLLVLLPLVGVSSSIASCRMLEDSPELLEIDPDIERGFAFLESEVRSWRGENGCFSCHNNGDAARAIYLRMRLAARLPGGSKRSIDPIAETSAWLCRPSSWSEQEDDSPFKDERLARLQFSSALAAFVSAGGAPVAATGPAPLVDAARRLARDQARTGAWQESTTGEIGSPVTYGPALATAIARDVLAQAGAGEFAEPIARADRWLRSAPLRNVVEAGGLLLGLGGAVDPPARRRCLSALELLERAVGPDGGFGPYANSKAEVFDTALVVVALSAWRAGDGLGPRIQRLRSGAVHWLRGAQLDDGSFAETTRPEGRESYAHWISTTAWALQALLLATVAD